MCRLAQEIFPSPSYPLATGGGSGPPPILAVPLRVLLAGVSFALVLAGSSGSALAVKASPPDATCTAPCETCIEMEHSSGGDRCVKCGPDPKCLGGDPGLAGDFTELLKAHNRYRARHGTPDLKWSPELAEGAQQWANACTRKHASDAFKSFGENLYWGTRAASTDAVNWWYDEIKHYDFANPYVSFTGGDTDRNKEVRHFTQVVWRGSKQVGCGAASCSGMNYWVCRYSPPGNFNAQNPGVLADNVPPPGGVPKTQSSGTAPQSGGAKPQSTTQGGGQGNRGEWSAFASDSNGNWGYGAHWATEQIAHKLAVDGCGSTGIGCKVFWTTKDRCVSYAESRIGGFWYAAGGGNSQQQAVQNAIRFCQSGTAPPSSCKSIVAECR